MGCPRATHRNPECTFSCRTNCSRRWEAGHIHTRIAVVVTVVTYGWFASGLRPFTLPSLFAILVPGAVAVVGAEVAAARTRSSRPRQPPNTFGLGAWTGVIACGVAWQLYNYFHAHRARYPTASSLINEVTAHRSLWVVVFVAWVGLGFNIARAMRRA